jgi:hypothetical protein
LRQCRFCTATHRGRGCALGDARGGNRVYFPAPAQLSEEHSLVRIVGREAAMKIRELGGIELEVPRGPTGSRADQRRHLAQLIEEGVPSGIITRRLGIAPGCG